ncbi:MAG: transcriptional repressor [Odoribacter sp.]|nr:transcriptional repressor [Odoribacter sp.]
MEQVREKVKEILTAYLLQRGHRKTPERYAILDAIYSHEGHFDIEDLFGYMKARHYRVSRATLYNTIELLLDCKLVTKHQFGTTNAHYERAYDNHFHEHLICQKCGKVEEFEEPHIAELVATLQDKYDFTVNHHLLYVYGLCSDCRGKGEES